MNNHVTWKGWHSNCSITNKKNNYKYIWLVGFNNPTLKTFGKIPSYNTMERPLAGHAKINTDLHL